jgi:diacylglycerol O-acyltransferase / wax synthase
MARPIPLLDLVFLGIDRAETPANVGVLMLFDLPPGRSARSAAQQVVRAYRAVRPTPPFDCVPDLLALGLPHWRAVANVDMRHHVRRERLAEPGDQRQLFELVAELHRERLDRTRPLFRLHVIEGLEAGQVAIYLKSHHASWDGRTALARIFGTLANEPGPILAPFFALPPQPSPHAPQGGTGPGLAEGARSLLSHAIAARELLSAIAVRRNRLRDEPRRPAGNQPFGGPYTRFNQPVSAERSFAAFSLPVDAMRRVARSFGGKVNDVVLAVVDGGVERYLAALGERPRQPLVAMCPVSMRDEGDLEATTKVATMFVPMARPRSGAARRLQQIIANSSAAKQEFHALSKAAALDYALIAFGAWFASHTLGLETLTRPVVNLVISNVGGLPGERYLGELRLAAAYPVSMIADPVGLNVSAVSLGERMDFGIVANRAVVPDADEIARHCLAAWTLLRKAADRQDLVLRKPPLRKPSRKRRIPPSQRS